MTVIQGTGVSSGLARGPLVFFRRGQVQPEPSAVLSAKEERVRFLAAQADCVRALETLAAAHTGDAAALLETHAMLAQDEDFTACILSHIEQGRSAAFASRQAGEEFSALFAALDDPYLRERAADIADVTRRLVTCLTREGDAPFALTRPAILCADDLSPSELLELDRSLLLGILTRQGSPTAHTAILARTLGIPAVCGTGGALREDDDGLECCLDGDAGIATLSPDAEFLSRWAERTARQQAQTAHLDELRGLPDVSAGGQPMDILCNIGSPEDVPAVLANDGRGIGLFRSEFLFLGRETPPDEAEQFAAYQAVLTAMGDRPVVIRTIDLGSDKQASFLPLREEANPALGLRGVRLTLAQPDLFLTQLRALYRASASGHLSVMFPMVTSVEEVRACRQLCQTAMAQLRAEGIPFDEALPLGIMVETPATVLCADALSREADFFCLGTNDLTQYLLACDRQATHPGLRCDPHHPAVLRAVRMTADAARSAGIQVSICGDLAGDAALLPDFLDMGIHALSVPPRAVLPLRKALRSCRGEGS